jgi:hypothetical protein
MPSMWRHDSLAGRGRDCRGLGKGQNLNEAWFLQVKGPGGYALLKRTGFPNMQVLVTVTGHRELLRPGFLKTLPTNI